MTEVLLAEAERQTSQSFWPKDRAPGRQFSDQTLIIAFQCIPKSGKRELLSGPEILNYRLEN